MAWKILEVQIQQEALKIDIDFTQRPGRHVYAQAHKLSPGLAICKYLQGHSMASCAFLSFLELVVSSLHCAMLGTVMPSCLY